MAITPYQAGVIVGQTQLALNAKDVRAGTMSPGVSMEWARQKASEAFNAVKAAEEARKAEATKKPRLPTIVYDPYNRLTSSTQENTPGGRGGRGGGDAGYSADVQRMIDQANRYAGQTDSTSDLSRRGPITTVNQLPADVVEYDAFNNQIACMDKGSLQALKANLNEQISTLQRQTRSIDRSKQIRMLQWQISLLIGQLVQPQPCPSGGLVTSFPGAGGSAPVNKPDFPSGGSVSAPRRYGPGYYAADYRAPAERVSIDAPAADLYSGYAIRAETREMDRLTKQMESLRALPRAVSTVQEATPQAAAPNAFPGFASRSSGGASDEAFLQADARSRAAEQASAVSTPVAASVTAEKKQKPWWWIVGAAALAMLA